MPRTYFYLPRTVPLLLVGGSAYRGGISAGHTVEIGVRVAVNVAMLPCCPQFYIPSKSYVMVIDIRLIPITNTYFFLSFIDSWQQWQQINKTSLLPGFIGVAIPVAKVLPALPYNPRKDRQTPRYAKQSARRGVLSGGIGV